MTDKFTWVAGLRGAGWWVTANPITQQSLGTGATGEPLLGEGGQTLHPRVAGAGQATVPLAASPVSFKCQL